MKTFGIWIGAVLVLSLFGTAQGEGLFRGPTSYVPESDSIELDRIADPVDDLRKKIDIFSKLKSTRAASLGVALPLAQELVARGKAQSDPRLLGQAEAVLADWWEDQDGPYEFIMLRADIEQYNHNFSAAIADFDLAVKKKPDSFLAWFNLAVLHMGQRQFDLASTACQNLNVAGEESSAKVCAATLSGLNGQPQNTYETLKAMIERDEISNRDVWRWATTSLAEVCFRLDKMSEATQYFNAVIEADPADLYAKVSFADLLLSQEHYQKVLDLLVDAPDSDAVEVRRAKALKSLGREGWKNLAQKLKSGFDQSRQRNTQAHQREEALMYLWLYDDTAAALKAAKENFAISKEPLDVTIYRDAALAANSAEDAAIAESILREVQ